MKKLEMLIKKGKKDIKEFMIDNPQLVVNEFIDLHNYYDANCYVETLVDNKGVFMISEANKVIDELDKFIKN